jgi:hypothetical protein
VEKWLGDVAGQHAVAFWRNRAGLRWAAFHALKASFALSLGLEFFMLFQSFFGFGWNPIQCGGFTLHGLQPFTCTLILCHDRDTLKDT